MSAEREGPVTKFTVRGSVPGRRSSRMRRQTAS